MNVVVDSNLLVALATDPGRAPAVRRQLEEWRRGADVLHAPTLLRYEVASSLTRAVVAGGLTRAEATQAWQRISMVTVQLHELIDVPAVVEVALTLGRQSAYDAAYIALAQELGADVWTLDGPLARNAENSKLPVKLLPTE